MPRSEETHVEILICMCDLEQDTPSSPTFWLKTWPGVNSAQAVQGFDPPGENVQGQSLWAISSINY